MSGAKVVFAAVIGRLRFSGLWQQGSRASNLTLGVLFRSAFCGSLAREVRLFVLCESSNLAAVLMQFNLL